MRLPLWFKMIGVLVLITACSGLVLSKIWDVSKEKIKENEKKQLIQALFSINPQAVTFNITQAGSFTVYRLLDQSKTPLSTFFTAQGNGFQGLIKIAVSTDPQTKQLIGIRILEQTETPGLGAKITETAFTDQFKKLVLNEVLPAIQCIKGASNRSKGEISAITGATISSKAVTDIIGQKVLALKKAGI